MRYVLCALCAGCFTVVPEMTSPPDPPQMEDLAPPSHMSNPDLASAPAPPLSDDFSADPLGNWTVLHPDLLDISIAAGALVLTPHQSLWYQASEGPLVYKLVPAGDFVVTSTVHARKASDAAQPPDGLYSLGGLMARKSGSPE